MHANAHEEHNHTTAINTYIVGSRIVHVCCSIVHVLHLTSTDDNVELSSSDDEMINKMVNISSFTQGEGVLHSFPCSEIKDDFFMPR